MTSFERHMGEGGRGGRGVRKGDLAAVMGWSTPTTAPPAGSPEPSRRSRGEKCNQNNNNHKKVTKQQKHEEETEHGHSAAAAAQYLRTGWDLRRATRGRCWRPDGRSSRRCLQLVALLLLLLDCAH